jgi:Uncharacterized protein conserved in bacteria
LKILAIGDIIGKPGRQAVRQLLPGLYREHKIDLVIGNGENAAGGVGLTLSTARELFDSGIDVITTGNHVWAHKEIIPYLDGELAIIRPLNYPHQFLVVATYTRTMSWWLTLLGVLS